MCPSPHIYCAPLILLSSPGPVARDPFPLSAVLPEFFKEAYRNLTIIDCKKRSAMRYRLNPERPYCRCGSRNSNGWRVVALIYQGSFRTDLRFMVWSLLLRKVRSDLAGKGIRCSKGLLHMGPSFITSSNLIHFSCSPLIIAALAAKAQIIHPALSDSTLAIFTPSYPRPPFRFACATHPIRRLYGAL